MIQHRELLENEMRKAKGKLTFDGLALAHITFINTIVYELENVEDGKIDSYALAAAYRLAVQQELSRKGR